MKGRRGGRLDAWGEGKLREFYGDNKLYGRDRRKEKGSRENRDREKHGPARRTKIRTMALEKGT